MNSSSNTLSMKAPASEERKPLTRFRDWDPIIFPVFALYHAACIIGLHRLFGKGDLGAYEAFFATEDTQSLSLALLLGFLVMLVLVGTGKAQDLSPFRKTLAWSLLAVHAISALTEAQVLRGQVPIFLDAFGRPLTPHSYLNWMHSTAASMYIISHLSPRRSTLKCGLTAARLALVFPCAVAAVAAGVPSGLRLPLGLTAMVSFFRVMYDIYSIFNESVEDCLSLFDGLPRTQLAQQAATSIRIQGRFVIITWSAFPALWVLGSAGLIPGTAVQLSFDLLNFFCKTIFGNLALAHVRSEADIRVEAMQQAEEIRQRELMLTGLNSELEAPMTTILRLTQELSEASDQEASAAPRHKLYVETMRSAALQLNGVLSDLAEARAEGREGMELTIERGLDIRPLLNDLVGSSMARRRTGVALHVTVTGAIPSLDADRARLSQAISHLLSNSLKFTHKGCVRVGLAFDPSSNLVEISMRDTGIGIAPSRLSHILNGTDSEPNPAGSHLTQHYGGARLGLKIVRQVVEAHGGFLTASSVEGTGSCFRMFLPTTLPLKALAKVARVSTTNEADAYQSGSMMGRPPLSAAPGSTQPVGWSHEMLARIQAREAEAEGRDRRPSGRKGGAAAGAARQGSSGSGSAGALRRHGQGHGSHPALNELSKGSVNGGPSGDSAGQGRVRRSMQEQRQENQTQQRRQVVASDVTSHDSDIDNYAHALELATWGHKMASFDERKRSIDLGLGSAMGSLTAGASGHTSSSGRSYGEPYPIRPQYSLFPTPEDEDAPGWFPWSPSATQSKPTKVPKPSIERQESGSHGRRFPISLGSNQYGDAAVSQAYGGGARPRSRQQGY